MLDIINKEDYFTAFEKKIVDRNFHSLKGIQDAWILLLLQGKANLKIAEIGGGESRVLQVVKEQNEVWNIDKLEGAGKGPTEVSESSQIKLIRSYMGEYDASIPDNYFDILLSISVVEHVPADGITDFFKDCYRVLKPGGMMLHAIDIYIYGTPGKREVVDKYRSAVELAGFQWDKSPAIDKNVSFKTSYASNSDLTMAHWNRMAPKLKQLRTLAQSVSIKMLAYKK